MNERIATWSLAALQAGEEHVFILGRGSRSCGQRDGGFQCLHRRADGVDEVSSEPVTATVETGGLQVVKRVTARTPIGFAPGAPVEFLIDVTNERDSAVSDVRVSDLVDSELLDQVEPLDGGVVDAETGRIDWGAEATGSLRFVPSGRTVTVRVRARIRPDIEPGTEIENIARVSVGGDPAVVTGRVEFTVLGTRLSTDQEVEVGRTRPGDTLVYLRVTNEEAGSERGWCLPTSYHSS